MALAGVLSTTKVLRFFKFSRCSVNILTEAEQKHAQYPFLVNEVYYQYFCTDTMPSTAGKPGDPKTAEQAKKKKGLTSPKITLILPENEVHTMTLEQAEKLSKRRDLKLVKIIDFDTKTERPLYKLMTALEFFQEGSKMKQKKKKEKELSVKESKLFTMSSKIGDHDLESKVRHMFKLLKKKHVVRVLISYDENPARANEIAKTMEDELTEVASANERITKGNALKLSIKPKLETDATASEEDITSSKEVKEVDVKKSKIKATKENN